MTQTTSFSETKYWLRTARTLTEALPYLKRYNDKRFVIKYGGHAMVDAELAKVFAQDIVLLHQVGIHPIIVHGGGPQIGRMLERLQIKSEFIDGLRVTDAATMEVVEMVLSGSINKQIVSAINAEGGRAVGLSGKDAGLVMAEKELMTKDGREIDLGLVGEPVQVTPNVLEALEKSGMIPVVAPIAFGANGETFNVNADTAAGAIAAACKAVRLLMLTDVAGVLDKDKNLLTDLTPADIARLAEDGTISGGMIPKVETCIAAVEGGVGASVILDGKLPHVMLLEIFTQRGVGTLFKRS